MPAFVANTNILELIGLQSAVDEAYIDDANITVTVKDKDGEPVAGQVWPATMAYVAATNGNYRAILEHDLELEPKKKYTAFIECDAGAERIGHWEFEFTPVKRTGVTADS